MTKPLRPLMDFNRCFMDAKIKVFQIGDNKPFDDSEKAQTNVKNYPKFLDFEIVESPIADLVGCTFRVKVRLNSLQVGDTIIVGPHHSMLTDGIITWYANHGQRYGHDWLYVNASIKGDSFNDWL